MISQTFFLHFDKLHLNNNEVISKHRIHNRFLLMHDEITQNLGNANKCDNDSIHLKTPKPYYFL